MYDDFNIWQTLIILDKKIFPPELARLVHKYMFHFDVELICYNNVAKEFKKGKKITFRGYIMTEVFGGESIKPHYTFQKEDKIEHTSFTKMEHNKCYLDFQTDLWWWSLGGFLKYLIIE
jgi:hypothetical protein